MSRAARYALVLGVLALVASVDLLSKDWAARNLATDRHLLPVEATSPAPGASIGDVVRTRFPDLSDGDLAGAVYRLPAHVPLDPADPAHELEAKRNVEVTGFFLFDGGDRTGFARRLDRNDQTVLERSLMKADPDLGFLEARRRAREQLAAVTLEEFVADRVDHLSGDALQRTIREGLYAVPGDGARVAPTDVAKAGETYLVGHRVVEVIPGYFDFSYAENPAGAWGLLLNAPEDVRRAIFFVLSLVAMGAVVFLLVRPPSGSWVPTVALAAILGGAIGNVADRLRLLYVVDFIHMTGEQVSWLQWVPRSILDWPRYNIADVGITVGVLVLLLVTGFSREESKAGDTAGKVEA